MDRAQAAQRPIVNWLRGGDALRTATYLWPVSAVPAAVLEPLFGYEVWTHRPLPPRGYQNAFTNPPIAAGRLRVGRLPSPCTDFQAIGFQGFRGSVQNARLRSLTDTQVRSALEGAGLNPTNHFIMRLRHLRTEELGMRTLNDFRQMLRYGSKVAGDEAHIGFLDYHRFRVVYDSHSGRLISLVPRWGTWRIMLSLHRDTTGGGTMRIPDDPVVTPTPLASLTVLDVVRSSNYRCPSCRIQTVASDPEMNWVPCPVFGDRVICIGCCVDISTVVRDPDVDRNPFYTDLRDAANRAGRSVSDARGACLEHQVEIIERKLADPSLPGDWRRVRSKQLQHIKNLCEEDYHKGF
jgi:hypothetical protein